MVDPTKVNVEVNVSLDFTIDPFVTQSRAGSDFYRRFIVDLYRKDDLLRPAERKVIIIDEVRTKEEAFRLPINLNVQPLDYTMVVWTDYIKVGTGEDYFYNTTALTDIYSLEPYQEIVLIAMLFMAQRYLTYLNTAMNGIKKSK